MSFCHLIQFIAVAGDEKTFGWASMMPMSYLSFVQCEQIKFRPKKNVEMKVSHSVVAVRIVAVGGGGGGGGGGGVRVEGRGGAGWGGNSCHVAHDMNFCIFLICLVLPFLIKPNIFSNLK